MTCSSQLAAPADRWKPGNRLAARSQHSVSTSSPEARPEDPRTCAQGAIPCRQLWSCRPQCSHHHDHTPEVTQSKGLAKLGGRDFQFDPEMEGVGSLQGNPVGNLGVRKLELGNELRAFCGEKHGPHKHVAIL